MDTAFSTRQSQTLAAIVDTFVPSVVRDDDHARPHVGHVGVGEAGHHADG
jgi:hypothetical protein